MDQRANIAERVTPASRASALREALRGTHTHVRVTSGSDAWRDVVAYDPETVQGGDAPTYVTITLDPITWDEWMAGAPFAEVLRIGRYHATGAPSERVWAGLRGWM